jgi:hypothetical protein
MDSEVFLIFHQVLRETWSIAPLALLPSFGCVSESIDVLELDKYHL